MIQVANRNGLPLSAKSGPKDQLLVLTHLGFEGQIGRNHTKIEYLICLEFNERLLDRQYS
jgi:hypothetical protein